MTLSGDQTSGQGVMTGGYVNPHKLFIRKYYLFSKSLAALNEMWAEQDDLEKQLDTVASGMPILPCWSPSLREHEHIKHKKGRGRHFKRCSVIAITLRYDFALLHNAFIPYRKVIASNSYRSEHIEPVIAFNSYRSDVIDQRYRISSLLLLGKIAFKSKYNTIPLGSSQKKYTQK